MAGQMSLVWDVPGGGSRQAVSPGLERVRLMTCKWWGGEQNQCDQCDAEQQDEECLKKHPGVLCVQPTLAGPALAHD